MLIVNKIDLAGEKQVARCLNDKASVLEVEFGKVNPKDLLGKMLDSEVEEKVKEDGHSHDMIMIINAPSQIVLILHTLMITIMKNRDHSVLNQAVPILHIHMIISMVNQIATTLLVVPYYLAFPLT